MEPDPTLASYQASALSPLGPFDRQRLLSAPTTADRLALLQTLLAEADEVLEARLRMG